ncbi:MAG: peroxide stress protein YaaA [Desulfobacterales bacterium]|nr:peroxide stress protein YaaA [Deltaproteobacteria bacterium]MBT8359996.1 peroxide stress protein YaaA [Deltaproteobacteria bacterium]NNK92760.1 peroxide stress protein YaaA [Desulfobacterales bacterium]
MLIIISPSKTQSVPEQVASNYSQPALLKQTRLLIEILKSFDQQEIGKLMKISPKLAALTCERLHNFVLPHSPDSAGTALTTFQGDVFSEIDTGSYSGSDFAFAQKHLRILSGLYGMLRPADLIQPYRLEMGTKLANDRGKTLYDFWGERITEQINNDLAHLQEKTIINCASLEYSRSIQRKNLAGSMLTITFKQKKQGTLKTFAIYSKRARGMFVDYIIKKRITAADQLYAFNRNGYRYAADLSDDAEIVFTVDL